MGCRRLSSCPITNISAREVPCGIWTTLTINSADDERNPPETGLMDQALIRIKNARLFLMPASASTRGHGTTGMAKFWKDQLKDFLASVPRKAM